MIVLDTNVVSELMRPGPSRRVVRWLDARLGASLCTTAVTQAEILHGIALLPRGKRREALAAEAERVFSEDFRGRILPFDSGSARAYAEIAAARPRAGKAMSPLDGQIAAIVHAAGATLATRNMDDFEGCGIRLVDPWEAD
jgi:predicted nucleic acid-binding protein